MSHHSLFRFGNRYGRAVCWLAFLLALTPGLARAEDAEQPQSPPTTGSKILRSLGLQNPPGKRGDKAYHRKDYEEAISQYGKAMDETTPSAPETPLLNRNLGNALYRQKRYAEATDYYESALKGFEERSANEPGPTSARDSGLASRTHHNLGNVFYRKAESADSTETQQAIADARSGLEHYKKALRLDPANRASKQNLEMANAQLKRLLERQARQPKQQQQKGKQPDKKDSKDGKNKQDKENQHNGQNKPDDSNRKSKDGKSGDKKGEKDQKNPDKPQPPKPGEDPKDGKDGKDGKNGEASKGSKMSEDEAKRLLNSFADDEKKEQAERRKVQRSRAGTEQDW